MMEVMGAMNDEDLHFPNPTWETISNPAKVTHPHAFNR